MAEFSLIGVDSLVEKLKTVSEDVQKRGGRSSLRKAAMVIVKAAKDNAASLDDADTGRSIASNIDLRWDGRLNKKTGDLGFRVGVKQGAKLSDGGDESAGAPTPHWRLLEFGTEKMRAQPFMRPAAVESASQAINTFAVEYEKAIDRAIKRSLKKGL